MMSHDKSVHVLSHDKSVHVLSHDMCRVGRFCIGLTYN